VSSPGDWAAVDTAKCQGATQRRQLRLLLDAGKSLIQVRTAATIELLTYALRGHRSPVGQVQLKPFLLVKRQSFGSWW
jgi:hypothetical protein